MAQPMFTPDEEWHPDTQPAGRLGPPGRKPPIAIACATPRPPRHPARPRRYRRLTKLQRVARGMLSVVFVALAALAVEVLTPVAGAAIGAGFGSLGAAVGIRLVRDARAAPRPRTGD